MARHDPPATPPAVVTAPWVAMPTSVPRPRSKATAAPATPLQGSAETSARPPAEPATPEALLALAALLGEQAAEEWLASLPAFKP